MPIYFVRHGLALPEEVNPNRPLSPDGREQVQRISAHLRSMGVRVGKVCHSGKTRAKETAQIFAEHIGDGTIYEVRGMKPNDNVIEFAAGLKDDNAMYVGHLPHLGKLVSHLVAGDEGAGVVDFTNAGVACIEIDRAGCHLEWYLIPSLCPKL